MLAIADVIKLDLFGYAHPVAGYAGLNNPVLWVHNAGVPDAPRWLNGGELVLTTIINMPEDFTEQQQYIRDMAAKGVAGLAITVGRYLNEIPEHIRQTADECGFPLIEIPYTARFVDIARAVNERIAQENMHRVQRALDIHQTLTQIVLQGGGFAELAQKLAEFLGHSISIENDRFEAIATLNLGEVDEARRYTQLHGRTDPRLVDALEQRGYLPQIRATLRPVQLPVMADVGLEMERILAPVVVHGEIYGYMWIIADNHSISEIDRMAIESGATIAALMMLYQESVHHAEASLKGTLLSQLIQGDTTRETILTDQSLRYGVDLRLPYVMMLVENGAGIQGQNQIYRSINQMIALEGWQAVAGQFAGEVVILAQYNEHLRTLATKIQERITLGHFRNDATVRLGVSSTLQSAKNVRLAHQQCKDVLHITLRLQYDKEHVVYFADLGYLHALYCAGAASLLGNAYVPILRRLLDEKQTDLFNTLEAYLDEGGNGVSTADNLHIHRSTLNYRLARIVEICHVNLSNPAVRMDLLVALKLMRLFEKD